QVSHLYAMPGQYTVQLSVDDAAGCSSTAGTGAVVNVEGPKAAFIASPPRLLAGETLELTNESNTYGTTSPGYTWDFGDGTGSNAVNESHVYRAPGTYVVTLTASDVGTRCGSRVSDTIVVGNFSSQF